MCDKNVHPLIPNMKRKYEDKYDDGESFTKTDYGIVTHMLNNYKEFLKIINTQNSALALSAIHKRINDECLTLQKRIDKYDYNFNRRRAEDKSYAIIDQCIRFMHGISTCIDQNIRNIRQQRLENKRGDKECMQLWHTLNGSNTKTHTFPHFLVQYVYLFFDIICGEKVVKMLHVSWNLPVQVIAHILQFTEAPKYLLTPSQIKKDNGHVLDCMVCYKHAIWNRLKKKEYTQKMAFTQKRKQMLMCQFENKEKDDTYKVWMCKLNRKIETLEQNQTELHKMQLFYKKSFHIPWEPRQKDVMCTKCIRSEYSPTSPCYMPTSPPYTSPWN